MYSIVIHGANSKANSDSYSNVAKTTVQGLTSYALVTLNAMFVRPYGSNEGSIEDGVGGVKVETKLQRMTYTIDLAKFNFNDATDTNTYTELLNVLNKKYLFLENVSYPKTLTCSSGVVDVVRMNYDTSEEAPNYSVTLELAKRKVNP